MFYGVLTFHGFFYQGVLGKVKRKRESTNKVGRGIVPLSLKLVGIMFFPGGGVVGREKARVKGEKDSTLIKLI